MAENNGANNPTLLIGLSFIGGLGLTLMIVALGFGVLVGSEADNSIISITFSVGAALLAFGIIAWFAVVQPHKNFDDISKPLDTGHHGHDEH